MGRMHRNGEQRDQTAFDEQSSRPAPALELEPNGPEQQRAAPYGNAAVADTLRSTTVVPPQRDRHAVLEAASFASYLNQDEVEAWEDLNVHRTASGALQRPPSMDESTFTRLQERDRYMQVVNDAGYRMRSYSEDQGLENGMAFSTLVDADTEDDRELEPILAFRGTELGDGLGQACDDILTDLDHRGVGHTQFENANNQRILNGALAEAGMDSSTPMSVTGHSLGGALGERFVARQGDRRNISELVTFNGAGTSEDVVDEYAEHGGSVPVHRHVVEDAAGADDIVQVAGHHLPSTVHHHRGNVLQGVGAHLATPLLDYDDFEHAAPERVEATHQDRLSRYLNGAHSALGYVFHAPEMIVENVRHDVDALSQLSLDAPLSDNLGHLASVVAPSELDRGLVDGAVGLGEMALAQARQDTDTIVRAGTDVAQWGSDHLAEGASWAADHIEDVAHSAGEGLDTATDVASDTARQLGDAASRTLDSATDMASDTARSARRAASSGWDRVTSTVGDWLA